MCLAVPAKILERQNASQALCDLNGVKKTIDVSLTPDVVAGDWVIIHVGFALNKIDPQEAQRTLQLLAQTANLGERP